MFVELVSVENGKPFLIRADAVESVHPVDAQHTLVVSVVTQRVGWTTQPRRYVVEGDYETTKKLFVRD